MPALLPGWPASRGALAEVPAAEQQRSACNGQGSLRPLGVRRTPTRRRPWPSTTFSIRWGLQVLDVQPGRAHLNQAGWLDELSTLVWPSQALVMAYERHIEGTPEETPLVASFWNRRAPALPPCAVSAVCQLPCGPRPRNDAVRAASRRHMVLRLQLPRSFFKPSWARYLSAPDGLLRGPELGPAFPAPSS